MASPIRFYSVNDEYGEFSNFAAYPITLDGKRWPTTEHYFQAQKFHDEAYRTKIRLANSPDIAARLGRDRKQKLRRDWESTKANSPMTSCPCARIVEVALESPRARD